MIKIFGNAMGSSTGGNTVVAAINPGGHAFTFHSTYNQALENITIVGYQKFDGTNTQFSNGITCFPVPNIPQQSNTHRVYLKNVLFRECGIGINKQACIFGRYEYVDFGKCGIGVLCKGGGQLYSTLYSGFDYWSHCTWAANTKACVYFNNSNNTDENQTKFENCLFEVNRGFTVLARGTGTGLCSLKFSHCWFEANCSNYGQKTTIDGIEYTITDWYNRTWRRTKWTSTQKPIVS